MQRCRALFIFSLFLCTVVYAEDSGIILCGPGSPEQIPAWSAPDQPHVIEQLSCGQRVSVVGREQGYVKIQIGERIGYVDEKQVKLSEGQGQKVSRPEGQSGIQQKPAIATAPATGSEKAVKSSEDARRKTWRHGAGLGFEVSHIDYEEPGVSMQEDGIMWGAYGDYTFHPSNYMLKLDARFKFGNVDYSSPSGKFDSIRDYNFETRFTFGREVKVSEKGYLTPYTGVGYRFLFDDLTSAGPGGYDRKSNYLYSPIGLQGIVRFKHGWWLGASSEYDLFWHGWQYSGSGNFTDKNDQNKGWGTRGSIRIIREFRRLDFAVEPYFRYWNIEKSDLVGIPSVYYVWEPANTSMEWGAKIGIGF